MATVDERVDVAELTQVGDAMEGTFPEIRKPALSTFAQVLESKLITRRQEHPGNGSYAIFFGWQTTDAGYGVQLLIRR